MAVAVPAAPVDLDPVPQVDLADLAPVDLVQVDPVVLADLAQVVLVPVDSDLLMHLDRLAMSVNVRVTPDRHVAILIVERISADAAVTSDLVIAALAVGEAGILGVVDAADAVDATVAEVAVWKLIR